MSFVSDERPVPLRVHLQGPAVEDHTISLEDLVLLGQQLQTAVNRVGRILAGQTASTRKGKPPADVAALCSLRVTGLSCGGVTLDCALPHQTKPTLFGYLGEEALAALVGGMEGVTGAEPGLPRGYDKGVLLSLRELGRLLERGITQIDLSVDAGRHHLRATYAAPVHERVVARILGPSLNRRTVEGRLLMGDFKETGFRCRLYPVQGPSILCTFGEDQADAVQSALRKHVRVVGTTTEVEGVVTGLRIEDIAVIQPARTAAPLDEPGETDFDGTLDLSLLAREQGVAPHTDFDRLVGRFWPEDESVDEFLRSVAAWREEKTGHEGDSR